MEFVYDWNTGRGVRGTVCFWPFAKREGRDMSDRNDHKNDWKMITKTNIFRSLATLSARLSITASLILPLL